MKPASIVICALALVMFTGGGDATAQSSAPAARPIIDEATLEREYDAYRASLAGMKRYRVSYIRIADEAQARDQLAKIRSGADFGRIAREHSTHAESALRDGLLGSFATCRWARDTVAMLDRLAPGQVNPQPVKGTHGWGIYRLEERVALEPLAREAWRKAFLEGSFEPECPWVPPVTIAPSSPKAPSAPTSPVAPAAPKGPPLPDNSPKAPAR